MPALEKKLAQLEEEMDSGEWIPRSAKGTQISPNTIRGQITRFLATKVMTQAQFLSAIHVNPGSFHRFYRGKYKDQWSAVQNFTYWGAAKFFAREKIKKAIRAREARKKEKQANKESGSSGKKRKWNVTCVAVAASSSSTPAKSSNTAVPSSSSTVTPAPSTRTNNTVTVVAVSSAKLTTPPASKKQKKMEAEALLKKINAITTVPDGCPVYDCCDTIRRKVFRFLKSSDIGITALLRSQGINGGSWASFKKMKGSGAGAANVCYTKFYRFFEKKRLMEGKKKTKKRLEAEQLLGAFGYALSHNDGRAWFL